MNTLRTVRPPPVPLAAHAAALLLALAQAAPAQVSNTDPEEAPLPSAQEVLARVRAGFPDQPWLVRGQLICRDAEGTVLRTLNVDLRLDWKASPPRAAIAIADAFGGFVGQLDITRPAGAPPTLLLRQGTPPQAVADFDPGSAAGGSDFAWADLGLDFLWWPGGKVTGTEMKKSRECHVVDLPAPEGARYSRVRLWIDTRESALLQADAYGADRRLVRRLAVKSLKKFGERWTVEDLDIERHPEGTRTTLRVLESRIEGAAQPAPGVTPVAPVPPLAPPAEAAP
jgi:hypothetical protein